jgi:hypothetical protein
VVDRPAPKKAAAEEDKGEEEGEEPRTPEPKKAKKAKPAPASETEDDEATAKAAEELKKKKKKVAEPESKKSKKAEAAPVKKSKKDASDDEDDVPAKKKSKKVEASPKKVKKPATPPQEEDEPKPKKPVKKAKVAKPKEEEEEEDEEAIAAKLAEHVKELSAVRAATADKSKKSKGATELTAVQLELARRLAGKLPARNAARKAVLLTRESVLTDAIVGADKRIKSVGKDDYMGGDGGPDPKEDDEDEEDYEAGSDEESEDAEEEEEDEEEEVKEEKVSKKKGKANGESTDAKKTKKRRPSVDSSGVELEPEVSEPESSEAPEEDDDDEDVIAVDEDDDGEGDDDGQESDADPRNMDIMTLVDTEAALSKRQAKRKKPAAKTRTPEELKLDALVEEKTAWKHPLPEPGIILQGAEYPEHTTKNDCRRTAAYKDLTLKLEIKHGKPEWSYGIMAPDRKGVMSFTKLRVGKDWNNKLQNWPTVRESGNARRVKDKWLPWVGSDKFRSMMRESLEGKKKSRARASSVKPASLAVPPGPAQSHTLEKSFAKVAEPEKKQKANGKREAAPAPSATLDTSGDMCAAVASALTRVTEGLIAKKPMLEKTRAYMQGWEKQLAGLNEATLVAMLQGILCPGFESDERLAAMSRTVIIFMCCSHPKTAAMLRAAMAPPADALESLFQ